MRRTLLPSFFALCASATIFAAPGQAPAPVSSTPSPDRIVTYVGCLERGIAATSPVPGATGTSGTGGFVLANATRSIGTTGIDNPDRPNPIGTSGTGTPTTPGVSYRLDGDVTRLLPHVGHKVEVIGAIDEHASAGTNTDTTSGNVGNTSGNTATLKVETVRMISASCTTP